MPLLFMNYETAAVCVLFRCLCVFGWSVFVCESLCVCVCVCVYVCLGKTLGSKSSYRVRDAGSGPDLG
jgi:hypothetical protein